MNMHYATAKHYNVNDINQLKENIAQTGFQIVLARVSADLTDSAQRNVCSYCFCRKR